VAGAGLLTRAVCAAEKAPLDLGSVTDDPATAILAGRRQSVDGTLEAIKDMPLTSDNDFERLVVIVAAYFAPSHLAPPGSLRFAY
jgi:hypothetical protein